VIDWLTCRIPVMLPRPIKGGETIILDAAGEVRRVVAHVLPVLGSFEARCVIRAPGTAELEVSGNLVKFLQGHNLYGPDSLSGLLWAALERIQGVEGVLPCPLAQMGLTGPHSLSEAIVTRVDCTHMFTLPTKSDVLAWLRAASSTGFLSHRGRGVWREGTLVFGGGEKKSNVSTQIVLYSKGQEVEDHKLPELMRADTDVIHWVDRCLRAEVRLCRLSLKKYGLRRLGNWSEETPDIMWRQEMAKLDFNAGKPSDETVLKLPMHLRQTYAAWMTGQDMRQMMSKATFYRRRAELRGLVQVDIALPPEDPVSMAQPAGVVPLRRTLEAVPAGRPAWANDLDARLRAAGATVLQAA